MIWRHCLNMTYNLGFCHLWLLYQKKLLTSSEILIEKYLIHDLYFY